MCFKNSHPPPCRFLRRISIIYAIIFPPFPLASPFPPKDATLPIRPLLPPTLLFATRTAFTCSH